MLVDQQGTPSPRWDDPSTGRRLIDVPEAKESVRAFEERDIPRVCELFGHTFRPGRPYRSQDLAACIKTTYLDAPAYTPDTGSIVHVDAAGRIDGFMGVIPITMSLGERTLRGGILSAYMADDPKRNPTIGVSLVRGVMGRGFDLLFTDTANRTSLDIARALRFTILPSQSLEWVKILRPAGTGFHFVGKRFPRTASRLVPLARAVDALVSRFRPSEPPNLRKRAATAARTISAQAFVDVAHEFVRSYDLKPAWTDRAELAWFVDQAGLQTKYGALQIREVVDRGERRIGLYLFYARPDGVAYALQTLSKPHHEESVVGHLLADAAREGAVAVRGSTSSGIVQGLLRHPGVFYHHVMGSIAWSGDPGIAAVLRGGNVFIGGLAGETWARIVTEDFA